MTDYLQQRYDTADPDIASAVDQVFFWSSRFGALLLDHIELRPGLRVLDLACGTGFPLFELAQMLGGTSRVTGLDTWKSALERVKLKRRAYGASNISVVEGDGARMPFAASSFDLIVSNLGVNNFADPPSVLAECCRVAMPGARLALTTNVVGHMAEFYNAFRQTLAELGRPDYMERLAANERHRGTRESVCVLLEESGFRVTKAVEGTFTMRYLDGTALLNHFLTKIGFLEGWRSVIDPEDEAAVFTTLERRLNEFAVSEGELRMTIPMLYVEAQKPT